MKKGEQMEEFIENMALVFETISYRDLQNECLQFVRNNGYQDDEIEYILEDLLNKIHERYQFIN